MRAVAAGALVTAVVGTIVSPEAVGGLLGWLRSDDSSTSDSSPASASEPTLVRKSVHPAISVLAPSSWPASRAKVTLAGSRLPSGRMRFPEVPGVAMSVGLRPDLAARTDPRLYVAVSSYTAEQLGVQTAEDPEAILREQIQEPDWTIDGCTLVDEGDMTAGQLSGLFRRWEGCFGVPDQVLIESWTVTPSRQVVVAIQFNHADETSEATAAEMLSSIVINEAKLPPSSGHGEVP